MKAAVHNIKHRSRNDIQFLSGFFWKFLKEDEKQNQLAQRSMRGED